MNNSQNEIKSKNNVAIFTLKIILIIIMIPTLLFSLLVKADIYRYSELAERHGDYNEHNIYNKISRYDAVLYNALKVKTFIQASRNQLIEYLTDQNMMTIFLPIKKLEESATEQEEMANRTSMYNFVVKYQRPELLGIFLNCKKQNEPYVCFGAFNQYDKLYNKGVIDIVSFNGFVANETYEMEKLRKEMKEAAEKRRIEEEEEKRLEDEKKRTKLYSCIENESGLICKKVEQ